MYFGKKTSLRDILAKFLLCFCGIFEICPPQSRFKYLSIRPQSSDGASRKKYYQKKGQGGGGVSVKL